MVNNKNIYKHTTVLQNQWHSLGQQDCEMRTGEIDRDRCKPHRRNEFLCSKFTPHVRTGTGTMQQKDGNSFCIGAGSAGENFKFLQKSNLSSTVSIIYTSTTFVFIQRSSTKRRTEDYGEVWTSG